MSVDTFNYNAGTQAASDWVNIANAWDSTDGTYATRDIPKNTTSYETTKWIKGTGVTVSGLGSNITKVEIGVEAKASDNSSCQLQFIAVFSGTTDGDSYYAQPGDYLITSDTTTWADITNDTNSPGLGNWTLSDIQNLDIRLCGKNNNPISTQTISIDQLYVRVTSDNLTPNNPVNEQLHYYSSSTNSNLSSDNFNDNSFDTGIWGSYDMDSGGFGSMVEQNQRLEFSGTTGSGTNDYWEQRIYQDSVSGDYSVSVKIVSEAIDSGTGYSMENWLITDSSPSSSYNDYIGRTKTDSSDDIEWYFNGTPGSTTFTYTLPYYLRVDYLSGTMYLKSSDDGSSWTTHASGAVTAANARYIIYDAFTKTLYTTDVSSHVYIDDFTNLDAGGTTNINIYPLSSGISEYMNCCYSGTTTGYIPVVSGAGTGSYPTDLRIRKSGYTCTVQSEK